MEPPTPAYDLSPIRQRALQLFGFLFLGGTVLVLLVAANTFLAIFERLLRLVDRVRLMAGWPIPSLGPDYVLLAAALALLAIPILALIWMWRWYTKTWNRRLLATWGSPELVGQFANQRHFDSARRSAYLTALAASPRWSSLRLPSDPHLIANAIFASLERDVVQRAALVGLSVGLTRNPWISAFTIAGAALELQLSVLTALGRRPTIATWYDLLRRTAASLFVNTYLSREDAWEVTLAIRKIALGVEVAAGAADQAVGMLQDTPWTDHLDSLFPDDSGPAGALKAGLFAGLNLVGISAGIGAAGLHEVARILGHYGEEILEGVLAGGVLYFHGMSLAGDTVAVDATHRRVPDLNRSMTQAVTAIGRVAGEALARQVRSLREVLRQRSRLQAEALRQSPVKLKDKVLEKGREWFAARKESGPGEDLTGR